MRHVRHSRVNITQGRMVLTGFCGCEGGDERGICCWGAFVGLGALLIAVRVVDDAALLGA